MTGTAQFRAGAGNTALNYMPGYAFNNSDFALGSTAGMNYREFFGIPTLEFGAFGFTFLTLFSAIIPNAPVISLDTLNTVGAGFSNVRYLGFKELTDTQRNALTAIEGMVIYNTTSNRLEFYNGATWGAV